MKYLKTYESIAHVYIDSVSCHITDFKSFVELLENPLRLDENGYNLLNYAIDEGDYEQVSYLLKKYNFDINKPDKDNKLPISHAFNVDIEIVDFLIETGKLDIKNSYYDGFLFNLVYDEYFETIIIFLNTYPDYNWKKQHNGKYFFEPIDEPLEKETLDLFIDEINNKEIVDLIKKKRKINQFKI